MLHSNSPASIFDLHNNRFLLIANGNKSPEIICCEFTSKPSDPSILGTKVRLTMCNRHAEL
ncbi:hypothetical protein ZHAS_00015254 [Anopheles sinensis]|uniref:Uncharacterized protein n=1 Tax=Anopheles sinensis TaxID=74873 RepID=A0A084WAI5_ANOSI|nr:hypothetical protein ZHAS_00015254 [Anopheles sinensis]